MSDDKKTEIMEEINNMDFKKQGILFNSSTLDNTGVWIITISMDKNGETEAKILSQVDEVLHRFSPTVLENGASAYYNKRLYPLVNDFERLLREFLYLISAQNPSANSIEKINNLEEKDFGCIYKELFVDKKYMNSLREYFNNKAQWNVSKSELDYRLHQINENTPWMQLVGSKELLSIQESFFRIKEYRNDVMHAHNIGYQDFSEIKALFEKTNGILQTEIDFVFKNNEIRDVYISGFDEFIDNFVKSTIDQKPVTGNIDELSKAVLDAISKVLKNQLLENDEEGSEEKNERIQKEDDFSLEIKDGKIKDGK